MYTNENYPGVIFTEEGWVPDPNEKVEIIPKETDNSFIYTNIEHYLDISTSHGNKIMFNLILWILDNMDNMDISILQKYSKDLNPVLKTLKSLNSGDYSFLKEYGLTMEDINTPMDMDWFIENSPSKLREKKINSILDDEIKM